MKMNPKLYYTLNYTWGIIMTFIGFCVALVVQARGIKPQKHAGATYYQFGDNWGGISFGPYFFCCNQSGEHTKNHEFGHSLQNAIWGPLFPFVIAIPSFIRCQKFNSNIKKGIPNKEDYDAIWFEGQATEWGTKVAKEWDNLPKE
jgi:hypothetical protein